VYDNIRDASCILVYDSTENDNAGGFKILENAFPTVYYERGVGLCWKINGNNTGLPVQGIPGRAGIDAKLFIVKSENPAVSTNGGTATADVEGTEGTETVTNTDYTANVTHIYTSNRYENINSYINDFELGKEYSAVIFVSVNSGTGTNNRKELYFCTLAKNNDNEIIASFNTENSINTEIQQNSLLNLLRSISINDKNLPGFILPIETANTQSQQKVHLLSSTSITNNSNDTNLKTDIVLTPINDINDFEIKSEGEDGDNRAQQLNVDKYLYIKVNKSCLKDLCNSTDGTYSYTDIKNFLKHYNYILKYKLYTRVSSYNKDAYFRYKQIEDTELSDADAMIYNYNGSAGIGFAKYVANGDAQGKYVAVSASDYNAIEYLPDNFKQALQASAGASSPGIYYWELDNNKQSWDPEELATCGTDTNYYGDSQIHLLFKTIFTTTITPTLNTELMWFNGITADNTVIQGNSLALLFGWNYDNSNLFKIAKYIPIYNNYAKVVEDTSLNINYNVNITGDDTSVKKNLSVNGGINCEDLRVYNMSASGEIKNIFTRDDIISEKGIILGYNANEDEDGNITYTSKTLISDGTVTTNEVNSNEVNSINISGNTVNAPGITFTTGDTLNSQNISQTELEGKIIANGLNKISLLRSKGPEKFYQDPELSPSGGSKAGASRAAGYEVMDQPVRLDSVGGGVGLVGGNSGSSSAGTVTLPDIGGNINLGTDNNDNNDSTEISGTLEGISFLNNISFSASDFSTLAAEESCTKDIQVEYHPADSEFSINVTSAITDLIETYTYTGSEPMSSEQATAVHKSIVDMVNSEYITATYDSEAKKITVGVNKKIFTPETPELPGGMGLDVNDINDIKVKSFNIKLTIDESSKELSYTCIIPVTDLITNYIKPTGHNIQKLAEMQPNIVTDIPVNAKSTIIVSNTDMESQELCATSIAKNYYDKNGNTQYFRGGNTTSVDDLERNSDYVRNLDFDTVKNFNIHRLSMNSINVRKVTESKTVNLSFPKYITDNLAVNGNYPNVTIKDKIKAGYRKLFLNKWYSERENYNLNMSICGRREFKPEYLTDLTKKEWWEDNFESWDNIRKNLVQNNIYNVKISKTKTNDSANETYKLNLDEPIKFNFKNSIYNFIFRYNGENSYSSMPYIKSGNVKLFLICYITDDNETTLTNINTAGISKNIFVCDSKEFNINSTDAIWGGYTADSIEIMKKTDETAQESFDNHYLYKISGTGVNSGNYNYRYNTFYFKLNSFTIKTNSNEFKDIYTAYDLGKKIHFYIVPSYYFSMGATSGTWGRKQVHREMAATVPVKVSYKLASKVSGSTVYFDNSGGGTNYGTCSFDTPDCTISYKEDKTTTEASGTGNVVNDIKTSTLVNDGIVFRRDKYTFGLGYSNQIPDYATPLEGDGHIAYEKLHSGKADTTPVVGWNHKLKGEAEPVLFYHEYIPDMYTTTNDEYKIVKPNHTSISRDNLGYARRTNVIPLKDIFEAIKFLREHYIWTSKDANANHDASTNSWKKFGL
jgi:hypothetical protein